MKSPKTHLGKKLAIRRSVYFKSRTHYNSMYEAVGSLSPKFRKQYIYGCCDLGYHRGFRHDMALRPAIYLSELEFSISLIELIVSLLTDRKFNFLVEGEFSARRKIAAGVPQGSILAPIF
jgi:hypothetical protein